MSVRHFLATTKKLKGKKKFLYKDIFEGIEPDDMLYSGQISFTDELSDAEDEAVGGLFQQMHVYAIHSDFGLHYRTDFGKTLCEDWAQNSLAELQWFKAYLQEYLDGDNLAFVVPLWVGSVNNYSRLKTKYCEVTDWKLDREHDFEFQYGIIYQFVDGTKNGGIVENTWD
jgi:hypothetical protein